jgi:hypothetical protein
MPELTADDFNGFLFFESANTAYDAFNVTGRGGSGDIVLFGTSFFVDPKFTLSGTKISSVAGLRSGMLSNLE